MELFHVNPTLSLKIEANSPNYIELIDNFTITPDIKEKLLMPYVSSLYKNLSLRASDSSLGIPRYAFNEV